MKADFTRNTFHPAKNFRRVLMQQGRVQLDADWNEQTAILLHYLQTLAADVIGPAGAPKGNPGFQLQTLGASVKDFMMSAGRCYVGGILCEIITAPVIWTSIAGSPGRLQVNSWFVDGFPFSTGQIVQISDGTASGIVITSISSLDQASSTLTVSGDLSKLGAAGTLTRPVTYLNQPGLAAAQLPQGKGTQGVYLDVWERAITYVEDDSMREVALNGPDTAARSKVVWQARLLDPATTRKIIAGADIQGQIEQKPRGLLKAMAKRSAAASDLCTASPEAQYRGPENQLYRVEIHTGGIAGSKTVGANGSRPQADKNNSSASTGGPTFKWSRENGSVVFPIVRSTGTSSVELENLGRDDRFGLEEGDWVEAEDDSTVLLRVANPLLQVQSVDRTSMNIMLSGPLPLSLAPGSHPLLRRWDQKGGEATEGGLALGSDNAALIIEDSATWLNLENGVQIQFQTSGAVYRTGDYWLIPARTATGDVEWPRETDPNGLITPDNVPLPMPPLGVQHHYALLGTIDIAADGSITGVAPTLRTFEPLPI
jgi:hypothetical protein